MFRSFLLSGLVFAACAPKYGQEPCKTTADCSSGQFCDTGCVGNFDAGAGVEVSALCAKQCTTDADCANLGLKKPTCFSSTCGPSHCGDNPF